MDGEARRPLDQGRNHHPEDHRPRQPVGFTGESRALASLSLTTLDPDSRPRNKLQPRRRRCDIQRYDMLSVTKEEIELNRHLG